MSEYISFRPQDATISGYIRFSLTKKGFEDISTVCDDALRMLTEFSKSQVLMAVKGRDAETVKIHTPQGTMLCKKQTDGLLVVGFFKTTLMEQNSAMKDGVCFKVSGGVIVYIRLKDPYNYYFDIVGGRRFNNGEYENKDVTAAVKLIYDRTALTDDQANRNDRAAEEEEYRPEKKLANLLDLAESYSILSSELEAQKAAQLGNIAYHGVRAATYDRVDRVAYEFGVSGLDESIFKVGAQVELEDKDHVRHNAEIIDLVKLDPDGPVEAVKLLFNDHLSIDRIYSNGFFSLSFSTVNKDVQLAANEKIRSGEARAKYMDAVFGRNTPAGFEKKNLSAVKEKLSKEKHPPNKSQEEAIYAGINSKDVFLVMGPPGTGKTTVIYQWVWYFVTQEHKRVLVSSQNNKAVDNVLARMAEESDIDVIRIGSEAKLQANVTHLMFENKVAALRDNIVAQSQTNRDAIDAIIMQWQAYDARMQRIRGISNFRERAYQNFSNAVKEDLADGYQQLLLQIKDFRRLEKSRTQLIAKLTKLHGKLVRHEKATNPIVRFFTGLFYNGRIKKVRRLVPELKQRMDECQRIAKQYRDDHAKWKACADKIRRTDYRTYQQRNAAYIEAMQDIQNKPERMAEDIWDLFQRSRCVPVKSMEDFTRQCAQIKQDVEDAKKLQAILGQWQADMGSKQNYALNEIVLESVDLVGATCIGVSSQKRFANLDFDVTIIDEAGQIQVHNALVPMSVSNKLIMLGDHKQIPPSADQDLVALCEENGVKTDLLGMSLFEKMYRELPNSNKMMLDTQYRMPAQIADTISEWFYEGKYYSPKFKQGQKSLIPKLSACPFVIIDTSRADGRYERPVVDAGCDNPLEARIIADIIRCVDKTPETELKEVGVISAYKSQVKLIKSQLNIFLNRNEVNEMVATLDSYQGQERDIIVYSFTKSSNVNPHRQRIGFLNELRRLNVAMTRCKKMLVLVGDMEFLGGCLHCKKDDAGRDIYDKSERQFSDFINKMVADVKGGRGELMSYQEFTRRIKGGDT